MYLEWSVTMEKFIEALEVVHLSSVKYSVGGLSFMDGKGFVGISVLKRERKWRMEGNNMEMLQTLSFAFRHHVRGLEEGGFGLVPSLKKNHWI
jgi:hypothetical protein